MNPFKSFFPRNVTVFVSENSVDFTLPADGFSLNAQQTSVLEAAIGKHVDRVYSPRQIHGEDILVIDENFLKIPKLLMADGIMTDCYHVPIAVRTADCLPLFFYEPFSHVIAVVHAGWQGTLDRIAQRTVDIMIDRFGVDAENILVGLGPCIRAKNYEVGKEFKQKFPSKVIEADGKYFFDLPGENVRQLVLSGIRPENICDSGLCTFEEDLFYSYRKDGEQTGRILNLMILDSGEDYD